MFNADVIAEKLPGYICDDDDGQSWVFANAGKDNKAPGDRQGRLILWREPLNRFHFDDVKNADEVGIILQNDGLACVDLDDCVENGVITNPKHAVRVEALDSWTEISSSGTGLHVWIFTDPSMNQFKDLPNHIEFITGGFKDKVVDGVTVRENRQAHVKMTGNTLKGYDKPIRTVSRDELCPIIVVKGPGVNDKQTPVPLQMASQNEWDIITKPSVINNGGRNDRLMQIGAAMRGNAKEHTEILGELRRINIAECIPPLPDSEVVAVASSVMRYQPNPEVLDAIANGVEARNIYESGRFIDVCKDAFAGVWLNDQHVLESILYMGANLRIENAFESIHLYISGNTQVGKSDGCKAALKFLPEENVLKQTMTPNYIFYGSKDGTIHSNMIIMSDDTQHKPDMAEIYRNILTSWFEGVHRGTVIQGKPDTLDVPPRVSLILTNVDGVVANTLDGQDESRYLTIEVRRTDEQIFDICEYIQKPKKVDRHAMDVIHAVWECIGYGKEVTLHRKFTPTTPVIRDFRRYLALLQAHALLCGRYVTDETDVNAIETYLSYVKTMINSTTGALTRNEKVVWNCITVNPKTINDLVTECKMVRTAVIRALFGVGGSASNPLGGLSSKKVMIMRQESLDSDKNVWVVARGV